MSLGQAGIKSTWHFELPVNLERESFCQSAYDEICVKDQILIKQSPALNNDSLKYNQDF